MTEVQEYSTTLRNLRKKLGMTQADLGNRVGRTYNTVCAWETGKTRPPSTVIPLLALALEVSEDQVTPPARSEY